MPPATQLIPLAASASESFGRGFAVGLVIGIPIALYVGYKLARRLGLF